jgi:hypothetical protein
VPEHTPEGKSNVIMGIDEQFVSDAWQLDPKPTAEEIVELWLDQKVPPDVVVSDEVLKNLVAQVRYYLP